VTDGDQQFYEHWRESSSSSKFSNTFPYKLSLRMDSRGRSLMPFSPNTTSGDQILVTKSYDDMFHRLLLLRNGDVGADRGAVLTGQSGIGRSR
jgi:hypothetical protein